MNFKITNKEKCIQELTNEGYESILESLEWIDFSAEKHLSLPINFKDLIVSITLFSFNDSEADYIYNCIIKK